MVAEGAISASSTILPLRRNLIARRISAPPVGGIAVGREQERHVVVLGRLGDTEAHRDYIQEGRIAELHTHLAQIVPGMEAQLVFAGLKVSLGKQGLVDAAFLVGGDRPEETRS